MTQPIEFDALAHPWLSHTTTLEEYVRPSYYNELLRPYVFASRTDLDLLAENVAAAARRRPIRDVLELGIGTGRVTDAFLKVASPVTYQAVDLSEHMVAWCGEKYRDDPRISLVQSDSTQYLLDTHDRFDFIFSLWSFSHSVHQNLVFREDGAERVRDGVHRLVKNLLRPGGTFFLIHVDVLSEEQRILTPHWNRITKVFTEGEQSPSKTHIDRAVEELVEAGHVIAEVRHHVGEKIRYPSLEQAMEVFMNFHLESYFNDRPDLPEVFTEVERGLRAHVDPDGSVGVAPGCFVYELTRTEG